MTILLSTLAVAFAAFCVWLTVRIVNRRERWAIVAAVTLGAGGISAAAAFLWSLTQPQEGIIFDPIDIGY